MDDKAWTRRGQHMARGEQLQNRAASQGVVSVATQRDGLQGD
jgi:hypothetical protein